MLKAINKFITAITIVLVFAVSPATAATNQTAPSAAQAGIQYLSNNQNSDGSISGFGGETDWSVISVEASGQKASAFASKGASLIDFLKNDSPSPAATATSIERRVLAIAAAGENTANFGGADYNARLASLNTNNQIGDGSLLNDDIFGIIAVKSTNDNSLHTLAQDGLNYLLAHQAADGGFSYTTDNCAWCGSDSNDTAAALIALYAAEDMGLTHVNLATSKATALAYLLSTQNDDGGFGYDAFSPSDGSSTAWSLMALNAVGGAVSSQAEQARNWLIQNQNNDGGFSYGAFGYVDSDTSTSAHATIALLGTTWLLNPTPVGLPGQPPTPNNTIGQSGVSSAGSQAKPVIYQAGNILDTGGNEATAVEQGGLADQTLPATTQKEASQAVPQADADDTQSTPAQGKTKSSWSRPAYGVVPLGLVAVSWFMLESLKTRRVNYGT